MIRFKANLTYIYFKIGGSATKPPETLENFYVTANENYWNFIYFFIFSLDFSPLLILQKNFGGGGGSPPLGTPLPPTPFFQLYMFNLNIPTLYCCAMPHKFNCYYPNQHISKEIY